MNIFTVLSQGRGRLNEENLSAMLGYLLAPSQTHGLGDTFLRQFLIVLADACGNPRRFDDVAKGTRAIRADMFLEQPYEVGRQRRVIDIELRLFARTMNSSAGEFEDVELHRIAIENKVTARAADAAQFREEFTGLHKDLEDDERVAITMVFLTPPGDAARLTAEYEGLDARTLSAHRKAWLRWAGAGGETHHVAGMLRDLLRSEAEAAIAPVADYLRHTIKAFIRHIEEGPAAGTGRTGGARGAPELGDVVQTLTVQLGDTLYQIERYKSSSILVLNVERQEYEVAKPIFRRANDELALGVDLMRPSGQKKNTRTLGKEVMRALVDQQKAVLSR